MPMDQLGKKWKIDIIMKNTQSLNIGRILKDLLTKELIVRETIRLD